MRREQNPAKVSVCDEGLFYLKNFFFFVDDSTAMGYSAAAAVGEMCAKENTLLYYHLYNAARVPTLGHAQQVGEI